jgi:predicted nucleic acid-binding Zn ribbon protein
MNAYAEKRCPFCRETIREDAVFCRYCNRDLDDESMLRSRRSTQRIALFLFGFFGLAVILSLLGSLLNR